MVGGGWSITICIVPLAVLPMASKRTEKINTPSFDSGWLKELMSLTKSTRVRRYDLRQVSYPSCGTQTCEHEKHVISPPAVHLSSLECPHHRKRFTCTRTVPYDIPSQRSGDNLHHIPLLFSPKRQRRDYRPLFLLHISMKKMAARKKSTVFFPSVSLSSDRMVCKTRKSGPL